MTWGRRDPMAATRRANTRERMERKRDAMTAEQVEEAMTAIIRGKLDLQEDISLDDFRRDNLPMAVVEPRFQRVLERVTAAQAEIAALRDQETATCQRMRARDVAKALPFMAGRRP